MAPDFRYLIGYLGLEAPQWLGLFKTFGLLVALSFIAAAASTASELKRKEKEGIFPAEETIIVVGKKTPAWVMLLHALLGFVLGAKIGGLIGRAAEVMPDPLSYLFSPEGSFAGGILGALLLGGLKWNESRKTALPEPKKMRVLVRPHERITEIVTIAAVGGFAGAKIFNAFESWDQFIQDPASILASSGFTFYGGLITAAVALYFYARKRKWDFRQLCDATAPGLILAYGIGRLGCQFAGDGDWGIINSAYVTNAGGQLEQAANPGAYRQMLLASPEFARDQAANNGTPVAKWVTAPGALPRWAVAQNYPQNVNNIGVPLQSCSGDYCSVLPVAVFPTPIYEAIMGIGIFFLLWRLRRRLRRPLQLFGIYLVLNGLERFSIEQIRVNYKYDWGALHPSQAEIIAVCLMIAGGVILAFYRPKKVLPSAPKVKVLA